MNNFPNHYETLNVSKDASSEEIRASYHSLCKLFHPDLNPDIQDGISMIEELTIAYEVLKDVNARQDYDMKYLIEMRRKSAPKKVAAVEALPALPSLPELPVEANEAPIYLQAPLHKQPKSKTVFALTAAAVAAIAVVGALSLGTLMPKNTTSKLNLVDINEVISKSTFVRPSAAPNGSPFPETSAYIQGYELGRNDGTSSLLVSNAKGESDVYLKLISVDDNKPSAVRHVFIKAKSDFTIENLATGKYEVQYLDLVAGLAGKSEMFSVEETKTDIGIKSTSLKVTLQTAVNGVMKVQNVSIDDFNSLASL